MQLIRGTETLLDCLNDVALFHSESADCECIVGLFDCQKRSTYNNEPFDIDDVIHLNPNLPTAMSGDVFLYQCYRDVCVNVR